MPAVAKPTIVAGGLAVVAADAQALQVAPAVVTGICIDVIDHLRLPHPTLLLAVHAQRVGRQDAAPQALPRCTGVAQCPLGSAPAVALWAVPLALIFAVPFAVVCQRDQGGATRRFTRLGGTLRHLWSVSNAIKLQAKTT